MLLVKYNPLQFKYIDFVWFFANYKTKIKFVKDYEQVPKQ